MHGMPKWFIALCLGAALAGCGRAPDTAATRDTGAAFALTQVPSPAAEQSLAPHLAAQPNGGVLLSWLEPVDEAAHALKFATLDAQGGQWSTPQTIATDTGWFVNSADIPSVVPISDKLRVAHWLVKKPGGTYSYDIAMAVSADGGRNWNAPFSPHDDGTPTEHGFVSIFPWSEGFGAVWLDGRNMAPDSGASESPPDGEYGGMTLRYARFSADGARIEQGQIDELVCECCMTDVALSSAGPVVAYRNRSTEEIRDIQVRHHVAGGWSAPVNVADDNWLIRGCPVNGPAIAANGELVVVAWYAAPERKGRIKVAWSADAGRTFAAPILLEADGSRGRVDIALLDGDTAVVSWVRKAASGEGQLRMRSVTPAGELGPVQSVSTGAYSRSSGLPQMIHSEGQLVLAWPVTEPARQILTAVVPLHD